MLQTRPAVDDSGPVNLGQTVSMVPRLRAVKEMVVRFVLDHHEVNVSFYRGQETPLMLLESQDISGLSRQDRVANLPLKAPQGTAKMVFIPK